MLSNISKNLQLKSLMNSVSKFRYYIRNNEKIRLLACVLSGFFSSVPFYFERLFIIEWVCFIPLFCTLFSRNNSRRHTFLYGFLFHFSRSVIILSWFKELYFMQSLSIPPIVMIFIIAAAIIGLSAIQAIPFGLCSFIIVKFEEKNLPSLFLPLISAILFTAGELINTVFQQVGLVGFPWVQTYISQSGFIFGIQSASVLGAHFISFLIIICNAFIACAVTKCGIVQKICVILPIGLFTLNLFYGIICLETNSTFENSINALAYQDNNSSYSKWNGSSKDICDGFISDMENTYNEKNMPELIVLSETVFPISINNSSTGAYIRNALCDFTEKYKNTIVAGGFLTENGKRYNAQFVFENGRILDTVYKKRTLVPFGEYIPAEKLILNLFPFFDSFNLSGDALTKSVDTNIIKSSVGNLGGLICYDSIFYYNTSTSVKDGAQILVLSTNDSWYNDSGAAYHHYAQAVFRAVESRKPLVRSATTGFCGIIDKYGRTLDKTKLLQKDYAAAEISKNSELSAFVRMGYSWYYTLCIITLVFIAVSKFKRRKL
ncbi:MAG: apolipoprotein N-acyltransferase [Ruminococcaceae bacterium]|nr:apolipoprotein N-acyltransferase [Oscillospiraceae bacterium]